MEPSSQSDQRARSVLRLERLTVAVAAGEALAALASGLVAGSVALVAFGADSLIEMLSALVVLSQLSALVHARESRRVSPHRSHRLLALLFFALALYVTLSAVLALVSAHHAHENALGVGVSAVSSLAMPLLAWRKRRGARSLREDGFVALARLVAADAAETLLCATLAVATLAGVVLAAWHWWWADPIASLVVVYFALVEGREAWACDPD